jgi:TonB-dependent receptor
VKGTDRIPIGRPGSATLLRRILVGGASTLVLGAVSAPALAQQTGQQEPQTDVVVITGIRASLERAMDIKREADGVVDAISAEDIGKFPDTNLAESLQRVPGVSINRVNGEGSEVTVRGFGGGFNLVTLNGRTMPTANVAVVGSDQDGESAAATSRSFDFSNLASEGVAGLQVYKTGRASVPSGGIGATINVSTFRPLDDPGLQGSVAVKASHDSSVDRGEEVTPELSGLVSWTDEAGLFGVSLFGSYQERDSGYRSATSNFWNIERGAQFLNPTNGRVTASTQITNPPGPNQLVSFTNDSRYHAADVHRERLNGQLTMQFRPMESLLLTGDVTYATNTVEEERMDQGNWFNRPFNQVIFDGSPAVSTAVFMQENIAGVKDLGFEQQFRAVEDTLESYGFNAAWDATERLTLTLDAHSSLARSVPNGPFGASSIRFGMGAPVITSHSVDWRSGFPDQQYTVNDALRGNANGALDVGDLGSQVGRLTMSSQKQRLNEVRLDGEWEFETSRFDFGVDYRNTKMTQGKVDTMQTLGDWGIGDPGDIEQFAPGVVEAFCLGCLFKDYTPGDAQVAFRGNAADLYRALSAAYAANPVNISERQFNVVEEDILAFYAQFGMDAQFLGRPAHLLAGVRYEETEVDAFALVSAPAAIVWQADNDFNPVVSGLTVPVSGEGSYGNLLPSLDFSVDVTDDLVGRVSFSRTLARADFGNLFVSDSVGSNSPQRPTVFGGIAQAASGNPDLLPLVSDNFDVSAEWYYGDANYVSLGFYEKRVSNFIGTGQTTRNLFGLRDPSSGAAGTRSGQALTALAGIPGAGPTDVNLFTMTALIVKNNGNVNAASAEFQANSTNGVLNQTFVDQTLQQFDVIANASDPLFNFAVTQPINSRDARIYGIEIAAQHFFGDTGFGLAGSLTTVDGDVEIDVGADPNVDQFALLGLSDTYNITAIYEKYGVSARLTYNWRDEYLAQTNRGQGARNPVFYEAFGQLDLNVSYELTDNILLTFEGINLLEEGVRTFGRDESNLFFAQELDARYLLGARYKF